MILIIFMFLLTTIIISLIVIALKNNSKACDFELHISFKSITLKFKTNEKSAPSNKRKH